MENILYQSDFLHEGEAMYKLAEKLFPICRSITGNGLRKTLQFLSEKIPLEITEIPSGTKVFDWDIPDEWNIKDAWVKNANGEKIIDFKSSNLHVLHYSEPIDKTITLSELKEHLFALPEYPDWIPYRTSFYKRQWGFCTTFRQLESLTEQEYHVKIDAALEPGSLTYGEFLIPGESTDEVLFSCHVCHPSLCNDNLSGIVIATHLAALLKQQRLRYTYRFVFVPGTIGAIAWLSNNEAKTKNIKHGVVLSLLGDKSAFHYKRSRQGNAEIDRIFEFLISKEPDGQMRNYVPYGYDERQYCSPGFNLPVGRLTRKPYAEFPEYHTSADNLDFIHPQNLAESLVILYKAVVIIENNKKWINLSPKGEPQLGKRGLYNSVGGQTRGIDYQMALLWVLNYSDGNYSLLDIAEKSKIDIHILMKAVKDLCDKNLLKPVTENV